MPSRREPSADEAKALAHPLRLRILRLLAERDLTNKQLADTLDASPGTVLFHVRILLKAGLASPAAVRSGESGALEKPYRATGVSWWLSDSLADAPPEIRQTPLRLFAEDALGASPEDVATSDHFVLHLSADDMREFERQVLEVIDRWITTDSQRRDRPVHRGTFAVLKKPQDKKTQDTPGA